MCSHKSTLTPKMASGLQLGALDFRLNARPLDMCTHESSRLTRSPGLSCERLAMHVFVALPLFISCQNPTRILHCVKVYGKPRVRFGGQAKDNLQKADCPKPGGSCAQRMSRSWPGAKDDFPCVPCIGVKMDFHTSCGPHPSSCSFTHACTRVNHWQLNRKMHTR